MIVVILDWLYISLICFASGILAYRAACRLFPVLEAAGIKTATVLITGMCVLTVYGEYFSLFGKIGLVCNILMLFIIGAGLYISKASREELRAAVLSLKRFFTSYEGLFCLILVLLIAFFTSRGSFHTDTGIYHAQAIRMIERYGVVKGLANVQLHFGYNSAYLVFCALFTFSWLPGIGADAGGTLALHTTTGWLAIVLLIYACTGIRRSHEHRYHAADAARISIIIYVFTNAAGLMSPATDYGTMLIVLYLLCAWLEVYENKCKSNIEISSENKNKSNIKISSENNKKNKYNIEETNYSNKYTDRNLEVYVYQYGFLSVLALFTASMKLSAAVMVLIMLYPLIKLVKAGRVKDIILFVVIGLLSFLPFIIRNVILTGWLFYPFEAIDLFNVEWKVPASYLKVDSDQIKVWGRCLYDISKADAPLKEWFPVWAEAQSDYGRMLLYGLLLSPVLFICDLALAVKNRIKIGADLVIYIAALYASALMWFFTAPFIRYGLSFILILPLMSVACFIYAASDRFKAGFSKVIGTFAAGAILVSYSYWFAHYANDDLVFIKQNLLQAEYYIYQKPFDKPDEEYESIGENGVNVYYAGSDEINSYYNFPGTCYQFMLERSEMMGDRFEDGWRAR